MLLKKKKKKKNNDKNVEADLNEIVKIDLK